MRWPKWWHILLAVYAHCAAQTITPTVCEDDSCRCDPFTRVICNCTKDYDEVTLRPDGAYRTPSMASAIIIEGCARVYFLPDTARNLIQLRNIELINVRHIYISERALAWAPFSRDNDMNPGIRVIIRNSTVSEISSHAIQGRVDEIVIRDSRINLIKPFAFSSLTGVKNIELINNVFDDIEIQAFKQFTTVNFLMRGGVVRTLPSRFLSDVEVTNLFKMDGVTVKNVYSLTFLINSPKRVVIERNTIETLEGDGFHIVTRGPIAFRNNTVTSVRKSAFYGFTVDPEVVAVSGPQELLIDNNTITELMPSSLMYNRTTLTMRVDGLRLNKSCTCELADEWRDLLKEQGGSVTCWYDLEEHYVSLPTYVASRCGTFKQTYWIFVVIGVVIILILAGLITYFVVRHENRKKKKLQIVLPDGKTYTETELHVIFDKVECLNTDF